MTRAHVPGPRALPRPTGGVLRAVRVAARGSLAVVVLLTVALAACGDDEADPGAEAAAGVAGVVAERLGTDVADVVVTCPEELDIEATPSFTCSVSVADAEPVDVPLSVASDGTVELQRAVVPTDAAETYLEGELAGPAEGDVDADCGEAPLLVADVGDDLSCEVVRAADGATRTVTVTVLGLDGTVRYRVEPAGTVAGSSPP
jgi:hypothetical protein